MSNKLLTDHAFEIVNRYSQELGDYDVLPTKIYYQGKYFFYIHFNDADKYLVVDEEGNMPSFEYAKPIIRTAGVSVGLNKIFYTVGTNWKRTPTKWIYKSVLRLLKYIERSLGEKLDNKMTHSLNEFKRMAETMIENQIKIKNIVKEAHTLFDDIIEKKKYMTYEEGDRLLELNRQMVECGFTQNMSQIDTASERNRLLNHLYKYIPFYRLDLWFVLLRLKIHHDRMLSVLEIPDEEVEKIKNQIAGHETESHKRLLQEIYDDTLNPR
ncbi:hypothetical protein ACFO25_00645 [Paenactinomyces guangxiensis]|uniref:Uncharacterized protein n=1 Tax=Paenactinomyces guangxiensis TaxID=1490290 RepID=A0A7W1WUP4_9BACL|nr:hypothetical protein [Paenactinomyces guangxiensis]MBA4496403.1 hypothetical protein [Paenactinomyces guangxiensis]MBH8593474.1 hypothetical protein [Paenactinomyces guangxiensis]